MAGWWQRDSGEGVGAVGGRNTVKSHCATGRQVGGREHQSKFERVNWFGSFAAIQLG